MDKSLNDLIINYCTNDVKNTLKLKKSIELKECCDNLYDLFKGLTDAGFDDTQAFMMINILIKK